MKYISNKKLYNKANIIRIDNFIISLIRNNILRCLQCSENNLIMAPYYENQEYIITSLNRGFVPPEAFLFLDSRNVIQNENGTPIFYHNYRRANVKAVNCNLEEQSLRYNTSISEKDYRFTLKNSKKYWWLSK